MKFLAGIFIILAVPAHAGWFCRAALVNYDKTDFVESEMWEGPRDGRFPQWAAMIANEVAHDRRPFDLIQLNQRLGKKRFDLEAFSRRRGQVAATRFGRVRATDPGVSYTLIGSICADAEPARRRTIANAILRMQPAMIQSINKEDLCNPEAQENELTKVRLKPRRDRGSLLIFNPINGNVTVIHPTGIEAQQIVIEVARRLDALLQNRKMANREYEFALCMHDYFLAMPFYRGSASIGRALFAGLYLKAFGKKINWPPDIDLLAMSLAPEVFADRFVSKSLGAEF